MNELDKSFTKYKFIQYCRNGSKLLHFRSLKYFFFMNPFKHISKKILETMKTMNHSFFAIWYTVFMLNLSLIIFTE